VLRYSCFIFLILCYLANGFLINERLLYKGVFILQTIFYAAAFIGILAERSGKQIRALYPLNYFVLLNLASAHAFVKFLLRKKQVLWTPRKGD
jgi:hypothetical protein